MEFIRQGEDGVDWINLAGDRDRWQTVWNTVMKLGFRTGQGICCLVEGVLALSEINLLLGFGWLLCCLVLFLLVIYPASFMETLQIEENYEGFEENIWL